MTLLETMQRVHSYVPYARELGMEIVQATRDSVLVICPAQQELAGDTTRGWLSTGALTALIDSACGVALHAHLGQYEPIATLDLRVDYLRPTQLGLLLRCRAECYRLTPTIAFLRALAWQDDAAAPVAAASGSFMRTRAAAP